MNVSWVAEMRGATPRYGKASNAAGPYMFHRITDYLSGDVAAGSIPAPTHMYLIAEALDKRLDRNAIYLPIDADNGRAGAERDALWIRTTVSAAQAAADDTPEGQASMVYTGVFSGSDSIWANRLYLAHDADGLYYQWAALEEGMLKLPGETLTVSWQFNIGRGRNRVARGANPKRMGC